MDASGRWKSSPWPIILTSASILAASLITAANSRPFGSHEIGSTGPIKVIDAKSTWLRSSSDDKSLVLGEKPSGRPTGDQPAVPTLVGVATVPEKNIFPPDNSAVNIFGNNGGDLDAVVGNAQPPNTLQMGCAFNSTITAVSSGDLAASQCDAHGRLLVASINSAVTLAAGSANVGAFDLFGNSGAALDAAQGGTLPANALQMGCAFNTTLPTVTNGQLAANECDARGRLLIASINSPVTLAAGSNNVGGAEIIDSGGTNKLAVDSSGRITTNDEMSWATGATVLTPTSATACTPILGSSVSGNLAQVINASSSPQTVTITLFRNEGSSPTCVTGDQIYAITLSSSASPLVSIPFTNGLAYTLSAAPAANIVVTYKQ